MSTQTTQKAFSFDTATNEELQNIIDGIIEHFKESRISNPDDYYLSDGENLVRDYCSFLQTKMKYANDKVKIDDVFHTSWGYDQTNIEYFKVVKISPTGKTCKVVQIGMNTVEGSEYSHGMADQVIPDTNNVFEYPALQVKIDRHSTWNPVEKEHQEVAEIGLRGSVYFAQGHDKHLQNLYRVEGSNYRSWYA